MGVPFLRVSSRRFCLKEGSTFDILPYKRVPIQKSGKSPPPPANRLFLLVITALTVRLLIAFTMLIHAFFVGPFGRGRSTFDKKIDTFEIAPGILENVQRHNRKFMI